MLNEDQEISPEYRALMERTWAPARVAAAAVHCRRLALDTTDLAERT